MYTFLLKIKLAESKSSSVSQECSMTLQGVGKQITGEPVKDIPVKQEDCGVTYSHYGSFSNCEVIQV